jgi:hypothetical protein
LAQDLHDKSVYDVDPDLKPINVLQIGEGQVIKPVASRTPKRGLTTVGGVGVRIKNELKVKEGLGRLMT